ncbi:hypothetical protein BGZ73_003404 [Actinomortierella ambigua]|nr:hypothetical protein BGZ73_003404 [Actinomortierella ambigua]
MGPSSSYAENNVGSVLWWKTLQQGDEEAIAPVVAKHAMHIRCLAIRSKWAFSVCESVCRQLTSFYLDTGRLDNPQATVKARILGFIQQQPILRSISLPRLYAGSATLARLNRDWRYFDIVLEAEDFGDIQSLLPHTRTVQVELLEEEDLKKLRLDCPHLHLRELGVHTCHFDHHMLRDILESFPNLQRLVVVDESEYTVWGWKELDLFLDSGYSMLVAQESSVWDINQLIPLIPSLLAFTGTENSTPLFDTLVQHCPRLMVCCLRKRQGQNSVPFVPILQPDHGQDIGVLRTTPDKSISRLLAYCQDLLSMRCDQWSMGYDDVVSEPWVCHKLKSLQCVLSEVPFLSDAEQEMYRSLLEHRRGQIATDQQHPQSDSEWIDVGGMAVLRKAELLETYIEAIEEQLRRIPEVDLKPQRISPNRLENNSLLQIKSAKASIQL